MVPNRNDDILSSLFTVLHMVAYSRMYEANQSWGNKRITQKLIDAWINRHHVNERLQRRIQNTGSPIYHVYAIFLFYFVLFCFFKILCL